MKKEKCCKPKCKNKAVAYFPDCDPDILSYPYCRKCLDEAKESIVTKLLKLTEKKIK